MTRPPSESIGDGSKAAQRQLPSVDRLLRSAALAPLIDAHGHTLVASATRAVLQARREGAPGATTDEASLATAIERHCAVRLAPRHRPVLNLSGIVLHSNLGRAALPEAALRSIAETLGGASNLEYDLHAGARGDRDDHVEALLCELTGAAAATVVNNNAGALVLTLAGLAAGREVIVSRGELVEIGGAFRLPDVMASAGVHMVEVGTTNRTHLDDYRRAITPRTALLLKVHTSNYVVQGFTAAVDEAALAVLAREAGVPLASDLGSGALVDMGRYGLPDEPLPQRKLADGCDVVTFSGDKLLGGPQAGLIVGSTAAVGRIRRHPLKRALRASKLPLVALEATLRLYLQPELLAQSLPTLRWLTRPVDAIRAVALALEADVAQAVGPRYRVRVEALHSQVGSGSLPVETLASAGLAIAPELTGRRGTGTALDALASALRALPLPVVGRIAEDRLLLDLRCLDDAAVLRAQLPALRAALEGDTA